jgi:hypothetical protein
VVGRRPGVRRSRRRSAAGRPVPPPIGSEAGTSSPLSPADTEISLAASAVRRIRSPCKIDGCPAFHQCLNLAPELGFSGNHVYPTASPAACFAGAGRLIAHVVHHIHIVSEGLPLLTSRMHANPASNIYCSCADRVDATQLRRSLVLTRRNTHQQNHFRLIVIETPGCGRFYARSPASRQASRTRPARRWLQLPERCSSNWREFEL